MPALLIDRHGIMERWEEGAPLADLRELAERVSPRSGEPEA